MPRRWAPRLRSTPRWSYRVTAGDAALRDEHGRVARAAVDERTGRETSIGPDCPPIDCVNADARMDVGAGHIDRRRRESPLGDPSAVVSRRVARDAPPLCRRRHSRYADVLAHATERGLEHPPRVAPPRRVTRIARLGQERTPRGE